ncbi:molybdate ABC transporter permease subunit [Plebeiibacterium sediminum]|uniref:Molybdenum transport system permease n=1 Tax=Plebeiibacterium sediminum TaxID=2992112 RepID=A0AAE3M5F4_9BACT|nr:molybdate ABC transporter permease subunit [Plebeiobacterium sediminum]MCW3787418.1 molybdate ABC transporter permease subunit [Plebeiobacterium sediminum]
MTELFSFNDAELQAIFLSVKVAVYCSLISLPLALWVGYKMARYNFYGKSVIESIIHLPLVMPPVTTGYLLLLLLGSKSLIGQWLMDSFGIKLSFSFQAAVIASVFVSFPLIVRSVRTAMEMVDTGLEEASRMLGAGKIKTFFKITVPLALPGIISGTILAFARSLGEFGATITFAGNIEGETQTLPLAIYAYMQVPGKEDPTLRLVIVSIVISFVAMTLSEWYIKKIKNDRG